MRLLKILGITLVVLFALVFAGVAVINLLPGEQYKNLIGSVVKSATGRDLVIGGDLDVGLGSSFNVVASDVRFSNPEWASRPEMFTGGRLEAEVALMPLLKGVLDVRLVLESPDLLLETDAEGNTNWQMGGAERAEETDEQVSSHDEAEMPLRAFLREIRFEQVRIAFEDAAAGQTHSAEFGTILLHSQEGEVVVEVDGQVDGQPLALEGGLVNTAPEEAETPAGFNLTGNLGDIGLNASGTLNALSAEAGMDLEVEASVPTLAALSAFAGRELPDQGPLSATARISGMDGKYRVSDIRANLGAGLLEATVTGSVADLFNLGGIDLSVTADTDRLQEVVALTGAEVPVELPPALRAEAAIRGDMQALSVSDVRVDAEDEGMKVTATGVVADVIALKGVSADIAVEAGSIAALSKYAKTELPDLGPFNAAATVASSGDTFSLSNVKADLAGQDIQASVEGRLADVIAVKGLDAKVTINLASLSVLNELTGQELPDSGPVALSGDLISEGGLDAPSKISGNLSGDGVRARVDGTIEDLRAAKGVSLALEVEADSVTQVARLAGQDIQHDEALKLAGSLYLGSGSYRADKLKLEVGPNQITGAATFTPPAQEGGKSSLDANLHLGSIDLARYFVLVDTGVQPQVEGKANEGRAPAAAAAGAEADGADASEPSPPADAAATTAATQPGSSKAKKLFPSDPLPFEVLQHLDADVEITADEIATQNVMYYEANAQVALRDGVLTVDPLNAAVGDGSFQAMAKLDAARAPARMSVNVDVVNGTTRYFGGTYGLDVDLDGAGDSIAEIMAGLDGRFIVEVRDLELKKSALTQFGRSLTDSLNPFDKEKEESELICAIVRLDIADGIANADDRIVAQMTGVTWFGGGTINLKTEKIDIGAKSKPRKGLGISVGGLASLVRVSGTLASPKLQLDPKDVAVKYGEHALTVTTGGLYLLLKGLWDKGEANSDVCAKVLNLEEEERKEQETARVEALRDSGGAAAGANEADSVEDTVDETRDEAERKNPPIHDLNL